MQTKDINDKWYIGNVLLRSRLTLAPMAGFTDVAFRRLCFEYNVGQTTTELISCKGLIYNNKQTHQMLARDGDNGVCALQLFGSEPSDFALCMTDEIADKFDIIDINMGCPARKITTQGEGSALMLDFGRASQIIGACVRSTSKPVSVKFRIGYYEGMPLAVEFARMCRDSGAVAITIHGRYAEQGYRGKADWDAIGDVVRKVDNIVVVGNGDVADSKDAQDRLNTYGVDAVAIGRGALGNPCVFDTDLTASNIISKKELALRHLDYMTQIYGDRASVLLRGHLSHYLKGVVGGKTIKELAYKANTVVELTNIIADMWSE